jgi:SNF2 family DNA or RNA helicase
MVGADCSATMSDSGDSDAETSRVQQVPGVDSKLEIDKIILPSLRPHQVEGVNIMLSCMSCSTGCVVADDMGLGKT